MNPNSGLVELTKKKHGESTSLKSTQSSHKMTTSSPPINTLTQTPHCSPVERHVLADPSLTFIPRSFGNKSTGQDIKSAVNLSELYLS
jgi:hypothetical protein